MELVKPTVIFDPEAHTYHTPEGVKLQGITGMLRRQLFPDEYRDVPQHILDHAAERGHAVHQLCELVDDLGITSEEADAQAYIRLKADQGLRYRASEYLVSDNTRFASAIDKVYEDGESSFILADIKTTYRLNEEYVRWQLSIYAYLFELQNPGAKASGLLALWIRDGHASAYALERIPSGIIISLLEAEAEGRQFVNPLATPETVTLPDKYQQMEQSIIEIDRQARYWAEQKKALMDGIMREMVLAGAYQWEGDSIKFTRKKDGIRKSFDPKRLEKDHPDIYSAYLTETPVAGSVTLKIKQKS